MPPVSAAVGYHVRLKNKAIPTLGQQYAGLDPDTVWNVVQVDSGYGRDALWLQDAAGRMVLAWRCHVAAVPRCDYCGLEGHTGSRGTAKTCSVRAKEVAENRAALSQKMKERWAERKASRTPTGQFIATAVEEAPSPEAVPF